MFYCPKNQYYRDTWPRRYSPGAFTLPNSATRLTSFKMWKFCQMEAELRLGSCSQSLFFSPLCTEIVLPSSP